MAIADLDGDQDGSVRRSIVKSLTDLSAQPAFTALTGKQKSRGIHVLAASVPRCNTESDTSEEAIAKGHERARRCLDKAGASMFLWGRVEGAGADRAPLLFVTSAEDAERGERYPLGDRPLSFKGGLEGAVDALVKLIVASYYTAIESQDDRDVSAGLSPLVEAAQKLLGAVSTSDTKRRLELTLLVESARMTIHRIPFKRPAMDGAVAALRAALAQAPRDRDPVMWALLQAELGNALYMRGEREQTTKLLDQAVACYKSAMEVRTKERAPFEWAALENRSGLSLARTERVTGLTDRLGDADRAFRAALGVWTRESAPRAWATTQNTLGAVTRTMGEHGRGLGAIGESISIHREALTVYTKDRYPVGWARTHLYLGAALLALSRRGQSEEYACEALDAHLGAWAVLSPQHLHGSGEANREAAADLAMIEGGARERPACSKAPADVWKAWRAQCDCK